MLLTDRVALTYGASGAVGSAVAHAFAAEGARLFLAIDISFNAIGVMPESGRIKESFELYAKASDTTWGPEPPST